MTNTIALFQFLSSRLCHDLISAFSSLQLGIEALEDQISDRQSYDFLAHNLQKFSIKAKALKTIFAHPQEIRNDLKVLEELATLYHVRCAFSIDKNYKEDLLKSQFFSLLTFITMETLPRGGTLTANFSDHFTVKAEGNLIINPELKDFIDKGEIPSLNAQNIFYQWALLYAQHLHCTLSFHREPSSLEIQSTFSL
jgi:hypothetical protein